MGRKKESDLFVNLWELDGRGGSKLLRAGGTRDPSRMIDAPKQKPTQERTILHVDCSRCRGTRGGPNPFIAERKCKKCDGMGYVAGPFVW